MTQVNYNKQLDFNGFYEFTCNRVPFGKMSIEITSHDDRYGIISDISTTGLLKLFVPHKSHTTVHGTGADFDYNKVTYESNYQTRKKKKYVKMLFEDGKVTQETLIPPDNRAKRPAVSPKDKAGAADPLSFILRIRQALYDAISRKDDAFSLKSYDGRRLTLVHATVEGQQVIQLGKRKYATVRVSLTRELVAGFTDSELDKFDPNEPPLYVYFSNDGRLMPIRLETNLWFGLIAAELVR